MRIISSFHDYYDISLSFGFDPELIYKRETIEYYNNEVPRELTIYPNLNEDYISRITNMSMSISRLDVLSEDIESLNQGLVLFCGKLIPFVEIIFQFQRKVIYDKQEFIESIRGGIKNRDWERMLKPDFNKVNIIDRINNYFNMQKTLNINEDYIIDKHLNTSSPIILQSTNSCSQYKSLIINPKLKNIDFYKTVDPYTAYQEISMFIGNYFGKPGNEMVEIDDNTRAEMHGFDKHSFRKSPTKKKK